MDNHVNAEIPVLLTCSHTRQKETMEARDCGANMLLAKPYNVSALYDRLAWMAHRPRPFVKCDVYRGPDRRFKDEEFDSEERRSTAAPEQTKKKAVA